MMKSFTKWLILFCMVFSVTSVFGKDLEQESELIYPNYKTFGELSQKEREQYLKEIGEKLPENKKTIIKDTKGFVFFEYKRMPYEHTECQIGYLPFVATPDNNLRDVQPSQSIQADSTLNRIDVRLDRLRVYDYPGSGNHQVMFTFQAHNRAMAAVHQVSGWWWRVYPGRPSGRAGIAGYPI